MTPIWNYIGYGWWCPHPRLTSWIANRAVYFGWFNPCWSPQYLNFGWCDSRYSIKIRLTFFFNYAKFSWCLIWFLKTWFHTYVLRSYPTISPFYHHVTITLSPYPHQIFPWNPDVTNLQRSRLGRPWLICPTMSSLRCDVTRIDQGYTTDGQWLLYITYKYSTLWLWLT